MRLFRIPILGILILLLSSCTKEQVTLEPSEVLKRSIIKSSSVESVTISASAFLILKGYTSFSGSAVVQGVVRGSGGWAADVTFQGRDSLGKGGFESGNFSALSVDGSQIFLKPTSLQGPVLSAYAQTLSGSINGWWVTGEPSPETHSGRHTLSPQELKETASLFDVRAMTGPAMYSSVKRAYQLSVVVKPDAVSSLFADAAKDNTVVSGTLWIDAKDFSLLRASWNLRDVFTQIGPADISFDVTFSDYGRSKEIIPPTGSASVLPLNGVFATIFH